MLGRAQPGARARGDGAHLGSFARTVHARLARPPSDMVRARTRHAKLLLSLGFAAACSPHSSAAPAEGGSKAVNKFLRARRGRGTAEGPPPFTCATRTLLRRRRFLGTCAEGFDRGHTGATATPRGRRARRIRASGVHVCAGVLVCLCVDGCACGASRALRSPRTPAACGVCAGAGSFLPTARRCARRAT
jgi:hypothetical protein